MDWIRIVQNAINEIEMNIQTEMDADSLARNQFVSSFYFQKMFAALCDCTVGEYIRNRRLTLAGYDVIDTKQSILDIAVKYQYDSAEGFLKAFSRFHGVTPMSARKNKTNLNAFAKISLINNLTGGKVMLGSLGERGYIVKETGAVYYTKDMDRTLSWFMEILGWYGQIDARNEENEGTYCGGRKMKVYNKLVRDQIPEIIEASGKSCYIHYLGAKEYLEALEQKLNEEVAEYQKDKNLEELADILEVLQALCVAKGHSLEELEQLRKEKAIERGGFDNRIFLEYVE